MILSKQSLYIKNPENKKNKKAIQYQNCVQ